MDKDTLFYNSYYNKIDDIFNIFTYNTETGEQKVFKIKKPKTPVYILKKNVEVPEYFKETMSIDNLDVHKVSYKWRTYAIAELLGRKDAYIRATRAGAMKRDHIFLDRRIFGSDLPIEDLTIMDYLDSLGYEEVDGVKNYYDVPPIKNLTRAFYDIETDVVASNDRDKQPITCSTFYYDKDNVFEVFIHIRDDFSGQLSIRKNEAEFKEETKSLMRKLLDESTADKTTKSILFPKIYKLIDEATINLRWYKTEKEMITDSWKIMIQQHRPMFLGIYNASYDINQTERRATELNIDPSKLFCNPEVGKTFYFNYRNDNPKAAKRRHDYCSDSFTKIIDTQITYFALRPQDNLEQESLDSVSNHELGFGKLDYSHITDFIGRLPYLDFRTYLKYNIVDVFVMVCLDMKTDDINSLITRRFILRTEYGRVFSPMGSVTNTFYHICRRLGYILTNDVNKLIMSQNTSDAAIIHRLAEADDIISQTYDTISNRIKISGGLCSDPTKFKKKLKPIIDGLENNKFMDYVMDGDAVSMYPKIIEHTNVSKDSLDGRITELDGMPDGRKIEDATIALIDKSPLYLGKTLFNLPSLEELLCIKYGNKMEDFLCTEDARIKDRHLKVLDKKVADSVKKILSKLDNTKTSTSDVDIGIPSTVKMFHINGNTSLMKINGSLYRVNFIPNDKFKFNSLSELFGLKDEGYIRFFKGEYYSDMSKYEIPKDIHIKEIVYRGKLNPEEVDELENNKLTFNRFYAGTKFIDVTNRTHVFLSNDVNVSVTSDDLFIFEYSVPFKYGKFEVTIYTKTVQYGK